MDQTALLRRTREDVAAPDPAVLAAARSRLMVRAAAGAAPARHPTRLMPRIALGVAATATVALVAGIGSWPGSAPPASAATLLHRAAAAADDPVVGPGEYLAVETREQAMDYLSSADDEPTGYAGAVLERTVSTTYIPGDRDGTWVTRSWSEPPGPVYGGADMRAYAARTYADANHVDDPAVERARGGRFGNGELGGGFSVEPDPATLPRDPRELLRYFERSDPTDDAPGNALGNKVIGQISGLLRSGTVPRDLRRAMYDALALLPGVVILDDRASLDGRTGTAIGIRGRNYLDAIVIDTASGDYLGQYLVQTSAFAHVPAGTVVDRTSVRITVVADLPR